MVVSVSKERRGSSQPPARRSQRVPCSLHDDCHKSLRHHRQSFTQSTMTTKRKRRVGHTTEGLAAGERLKRHKLATSISDSPWGWVGTEVIDASEISLKHRLATCSFARAPTFCPNKYSFRPPKPESQDTQENVERSARGGDDVIVISDDEAPHCNKKLCRKNPNCVNYVGQEKWENRSESPRYMSCRDGFDVASRALSNCFEAVHSSSQPWERSEPRQQAVGAPRGFEGVQYHTLLMKIV